MLNILNYFNNLLFGRKEEVIRTCNINAKQTFTCSNRVKTTKYTIYNFLLKNSFEQLRVPSCIYFVFIAVLQIIPAVSSTHGIPVILLPLAIVTLGTALRDAYEDYQRYLADNEVNNKFVHIVKQRGVEQNEKSKKWMQKPNPEKFRQASIDSDELIIKYWKDLKVGEFVILRTGDIVPADIIILGSSEEGGVCFVDTSCLDGETNVKKKESVPLISSRLSRNMDVAINQVKYLYGRCTCDSPNKNLMRFDGVLKYEFDVDEVYGRYSNEDIDEMLLKDNLKNYDLTLLNLLLRGCILRNTKWVIGFVIYTGHDTKIYRNIASTPHKISNLEKKAGKMTLLVWLVQIILCFGAAMYNLTTYWNDSLSGLPYLPNFNKDTSGVVIFFVSFFSWIAISATFVPISATVTINLIRLLQGFFIQNDIEMYYDELDMYAKARTTTLNEELGQVHYIFSDKTGTLTCNNMEFRKLAVAGKSYGKGYTDVIRSVYKKQGIILEDEPYNPNYTKFGNVNLVDDELFKDLNDINNPRHHHLVEFFIHLCCSNSVVTDINNNGELEYASNSPDELCFVKAAKFVGFKLLYRSSSRIDIFLLGKFYRIYILALVEFDYTRKVSSSVLAFPLQPDDNPPEFDVQSNPLEVQSNSSSTSTRRPADSSSTEVQSNSSSTSTRGRPADSSSNYLSLKSRATPGDRGDVEGNDDVTSSGLPAADLREAEGDVNKEATTASGKTSGRDGKNVTSSGGALKMTSSGREVVNIDELDLSKYRIVLFCKGGDNIIKKKLHNISDVDKITLDICRDYNIGGLRTLLFAKKYLNIDEFNKWYNEYKKAQNNILKRDELVIECMNKLEMDLELQGVSGIEDKLQDGVPMTIELLTSAGIKIWMLTGDGLETSINIGIATNLLRITSDRINLDSITIPLDKLYNKLLENINRILNDNNNIHRCAIIDGIAIEELIKDEYVNDFIKFFSLCHTVICCRMTPYLKGTIVNLVKMKLKKITLAIGDGANDCNMIQTADVGIGIKGKEGLQAFNTSDFGIGQFRFLIPLILYHGRCCYRRAAKSVLYMFYKNITLIIPLFLYGYISFYSGQKFYYSVLLSLYNLFFTSLPVIILGAIDKDIKKKDSYKYPFIYQLGQINYYLNTKVFIGWLTTSIIHGIIIFFIITIGLSDKYTVSFNNFIVPDIPIMGSTLMFIVIIVVSIKLLLETWYYNILTTCSHLISIASFIMTSYALSSSPKLGGLYSGTASTIFTNTRFWIVTLTCTLATLYRDYTYKVIVYSFAPHYYQYIQRIEYLNLEKKDTKQY